MSTADRCQTDPLATLLRRAAAQTRDPLVRRWLKALLTRGKAVRP